jgi:hypothetical protein
VEETSSQAFASSKPAGGADSCARKKT